ncbi:50S ribosomal protein L2 [Candidatus Woesearchaeota archaeon]|nr:50S ribosomal protein L2 [Candidatus Woesearchaeota archaeon]
MGKRIITQRRGRGTTTYKAPSHRYRYSLNYPKTNNKLNGTIIRLLHDSARNSPIAIIEYENKEKINIPAPMDVKEGSSVYYNDKKTPGSISKLSEIDEGSSIYNIESLPGSNGKFCRTAGNTAKILMKADEFVLVQLPSKKKKKFNPDCRATIGTIAGSGQREKPILKAGKKYHMMKAKNKLYPKTSGVAMNAVDHPFGSGRGRHIGKPKTPPRNAPPGRNVGLIRARRTGRKR